MAGESIHVHDVHVTVTEKSAAQTDLRPLSLTEDAATVDNPAQAADGSASSYAELSGAGPAILLATGFDNTRLVSDAGRDWVELNITGDWANSPDAGDDVEVAIRGIGTDSWTVLDNAAGGAEWDGTERTWTVTSEVGTNLESDWEVRITYTRNAGAGTFRVYDVAVTVGGDVVAPTAEEIAEDVEELAVAKFSTWWDALAASLEAALVAFGSSSVERTAVINALRDDTSAADAYATLTASATRASAEAYQEVATAVGFPRFTGS